MAKVLVVDDDPTIVEYLGTVLDAAGYQVASAPDGRSALGEYLRAMPDLVLLDVRMPAMDGNETLRHLRALSRVPVIVVSATDDPATIARLLYDGADDFVSKPTRVQELLARISAVLRRCERPEQSASTPPGAPGALLVSSVQRGSPDGLDRD